MAATLLELYSPAPFRNWGPGHSQLFGHVRYFVESFARHPIPFDDASLDLGIEGPTPSALTFYGPHAHEVVGADDPNEFAHHLQAFRELLGVQVEFLRVFVKIVETKRV